MLDRKTTGVIEVVGGMALLSLGSKVISMLLFGKGFYDLEKEYRKNNPDLEPGLKARWERSVEFYEETHTEPTNRILHRIGIPIIVSSAIGLFATKPYKAPWILSAVSFVLGWATNIVGHAAYEKNKPAFTDDPLSFVAGPAWDIKQELLKK